MLNERLSQKSKQNKAGYTNKQLYKLSTIASLIGPAVVSAGDGDAGDGDAGYGTQGPGVINETQASLSAGGLSAGSYSVFDAATGAWAGNLEVTGTPSTPFLMTWDGEKYIHENDFLFGKPQTAFANKKIGLAAYEKGIGGDIYLFQNDLKPDSKGEIKLQIREIEPEESYIDKFELNALDLKENEHFVSDGSLEEGYIFNTEEIKVAKGSLDHYHVQANVFTKAENVYESLVPKTGKDITLEAGDELVIRVNKEELSEDKDTFILVDSHYRDWTLGNQVPFSRLEKFVLGSVALGRNSVSVVAAASLAALAAAGISGSGDSYLTKLLSVPYSYAETPSNDYYGVRSLLILVGDSSHQVHLQTLFMRYVQSSQEVVRIPKEIIKNLKDSFLTLRVKATKKHKVRAAFAFQSTPQTPEFKTLEITKAVHSRDNKDYAKQLSTKDSNFLHTVPGDKVELTIKDVPQVAGATRRYVLKTSGFYTRLSVGEHLKLGKDWLSRLAPEDRKLLSHLRLS